MKKLAMYALVAGFVGSASFANAHDLNYMINPQAEDHKIPTNVTKVEEGDKTEFVITKEQNNEDLSSLAPAAGSTDTQQTSYDHHLGH